MARRIPLSFKENPEELEIFEEINKHSCKAAFIKEAIRFYMDHKNEKRKASDSRNDEEIRCEDRDEIMNILG